VLVYSIAKVLAVQRSITCTKGEDSDYDRADAESVGCSGPICHVEAWPRQDAITRSVAAPWVSGTK